MAKRRGHGEGAIYQRESDGKWCASIDLGFVGGKRKRKMIYGKTRKAVADKLKELHRDQANGVNIAPEQQTVDQYLERWLQNAVLPHRREKTSESYQQIVRLYLAPHLGRHQLSKLTPEHVQIMINTLLKQGGKDSRPLSNRTVQYVRAVLRRALNQALKWGYVARNAATLVDTPRVEQYSATILTPAQGQQLFALAKGHRLEALFILTLLLGLREGEVLGLRWKDVDFVNHTLRIEQTVQRVNGKLVLGSPKTRGSKRTLSMPTKVERVLHEHAARQTKERAACEEDWRDHDLIFPSTCGTPLEPRNLLRQFKNLLQEAQLPDIRFHDLRHSCATVLIAQGVHPRTVMEILGHSQISVTMNTYGHVLPEAQRAAATMMDSVFTGEAATPSTLP